MNRRRETVEKGVPPGNPAVPRGWIRGVLEQYAAGYDTRGRPEGRCYPWSQQAIHEISGLSASPKWKVILVTGRLRSGEIPQRVCVGRDWFH